MSGGSVGVTEERAQIGPTLFNEILNRFSETAEQNHKSRHWGMCKGENCDLRLHSEPKSHPTLAPAMERKDQDITGTWTTRTLPETEGGTRSSVDTPLL